MCIPRGPAGEHTWTTSPQPLSPSASHTRQGSPLTEQTHNPRHRSKVSPNRPPGGLPVSLWPTCNQTQPPGLLATLPLGNSPPFALAPDTNSHRFFAGKLTPTQAPIPTVTDKCEHTHTPCTDSIFSHTHRLRPCVWLTHTLTQTHCVPLPSSLSTQALVLTVSHSHTPILYSFSPAHTYTQVPGRL